MGDLLNMETLSNLFMNYAPKVVGAVLTLIIGLWIISMVTSGLKRFMAARNFDETLRPFLASLVSVGLKVVLMLTVADMFGVETTSFIAIFGAMAFAIGMALQGSLGHFASGVLLLIFKPYKVGDLITIGGGQTGAVEELQIFNTVLRTPDNKKIIVPNGVVTSNVITNISGQGEIMHMLTFGIGYEDDIDKARAVIKQVAASCPQVLADKPMDVFVNELADSSVNFTVRPWCKSEHYWDVYFYMMENVKKAFDKENINIPYPQTVMHQAS